MPMKKMAAYAAFASLNSNSEIIKIRSELAMGIKNAFGLGLSFEFDHFIDAVKFDDLCFYFSKEHDRIILAFLYPGSTVPGRLRFPGVDLPLKQFELNQFCEFLNKSNVEFRREVFNQYVLTITISGVVFYFDLTNDDRRIDITNSYVVSGAR